MSESSNESTGQPSEQSSGSGEHEKPDVGLVPDEDLPEDLQPEKNPLARDPGDESEDDASGGSSDEKVEGLPDMGAPGA